MGRCGVVPGPPAVALAQTIEGLPGLKFDGIMGSVPGPKSDDDLLSHESKTQANLQVVLDNKSAIEQDGLPVGVVSVGGTHCYVQALQMPGVTEVRAGRYPLMDHRLKAFLPELSPAAKILASVISHPVEGMAVLDAGHKSTAPDQGRPVLEGIEGAAATRFSAEHGIVELEGDVQGRLNPGEKAWLVPYELGATVNQYDYFRAAKNGKLEGFAVDNHSYDFNEMRIGRYNVGADYDFGGYLDDLRITKGVARYPSNFALPEAMKGDAVPTITLLTESMTVAEGGSVDLSVTAVGALPLAYQWSKDGVEMSGATQSTLTLADLALSDAGDYSVAVNNSVGAVDSEAITVTVLKPAGIDVQPEAGSANLGGDFTLKVVASGTEPISYQWHHKGAAIDGETKSTLSLTNLRAADMGSYHVVVSNEVGEETSNSVSLSMVPTITKLTESMNPVRGTNIELSVGATGAEPMNYQWYHAGTLIEDATSTTLFLNDFQANDTGDYHVTVSNAGGTLTSDMVTLLMPPAITRLTDDVYAVSYTHLTLPTILLV